MVTFYVRVRQHVRVTVGRGEARKPDALVDSWKPRPGDLVECGLQ